MFKFFLLLLFVGLVTPASAQNDFTMLNSLEGGPCLKMAQADNGDLYLLSRGGTLHRSSDHGENWIELPFAGAAFVDFTLLDDKVFAIDHSNIYTSQDQGMSFTQTWYFATVWLNYIRTLPNEKMILSGQDMITYTDFPLYFSSDAGVNWTLANQNILSVIPNGIGFQSVFIAPDGKIFVPTFFGEIVSSDEGQTFSVSRSYQYQFSKMAFDVNNIYSLTFADFVKSDYQAQNWTDIKNGLPSLFFGGFITTTDAQEIIWLNPELLSNQVYISTDGGDHWNPQGVLPNLGEEFFNLYSFQNELFLLGSSGVYSSLDQGQSWSKKNTGIHAQEYKDIVLANSKFFLATEPAVYSKNYADVNWTQNQLPFVYGDLNFNFPLYLKGIAFYNSKNLILYGGNHYDFMDSLRSNSWTTLKGNNSAGGGNLVSTIVKHDTVFSVIQFFQEINELLPKSSTWNPISVTWPNSIIGINTMVETSDNHILVSYTNGVGNTMLAKVSQSFQLINEASWNHDFQMKKLGYKIFDLTNDGLSVSNDNGDSWNMIMSWPWDNSSKLFVDEVGRMFIGTNGKFQMSLDTARTWTTYTLDNSLNRAVSGITTDSLGYVYVAVNNKGILKSNFRAIKPQAVNFTTLSPKTFGDPSFSLAATSSSGLPVSYSSGNTAVAKIVGNVVTIISAGSTVITATQKGNALYDSAGAQQTLVVNKSEQQIQFTIPTLKTFGDPSFSLAATSSSGLPVTYSSSDPLVANVVGNVITIISAGSAEITASQSGNSNYLSASTQQTLTVGKAEQQIQFTIPTLKTFGDPSFSLAATSSSGLPVTYSSSDPLVANVVGNVITIISAGSAEITASQSGNSNYLSASTQQTLTVGKAEQQIQFTIPTPKTFGDASFSLAATSSSGLPITYSSSDPLVANVVGNVLTIISAGSAEITASQSGNSNYLSASTQQTLTVGKAEQQIQFTIPTPKTFGDASFSLAATSSSGLPITYSSSDPLVANVVGNVLTIISAGSAEITASQSGNSNYLSASTQQALTVGKAEQQIQFTIPTSKTFGDPAFPLHARIDSKLPILFSSSDIAIVSVIDSTAMIAGAGSVSLTASQGGNSNYNNVSKTITFCISPAIPIILMNKDSQNNKITLTSSSAKGNQWFLNSTKIEDEISQVLNVTQPGVYSLIVTIGGCNSKLSDPMDIKVITGDRLTESAIRIYPNPAERDLNIEYSTPQWYNTFVLEVIDLQGRTVLSNLEGVDNIKLDVSSLSPSLYFLRVTYAEKTEILKFIKR